MKIRFAQDKDYATIARLHRQTIKNINSKDYPKKMIEVWSSRSKAERFRGNEDKCKRWVAIEKGKIIGFCDHSFDCELTGLYVHKDYIGQGVGSALIKTAEKSMKKQGCKIIKVGSTLTAKNFYKNQEYKIKKKWFVTIKNQKIPTYILTKKLNKQA